MLVPLVLICGAAGSAAVVAYGTHSQLAAFSHGISIIILARRLEWPIVALSLLLSGLLLLMIIAGRASVWWLMGLGPVLALFVRAFSAAYHPAIALLDSPKFVLADQIAASALADQYVVGFIFGGRPYALPYGDLANAPLVLVTAFRGNPCCIISSFARIFSLPSRQRTSISNAALARVGPKNARPSAPPTVLDSISRPILMSPS